MNTPGHGQDGLEGEKEGDLQARTESIDIPWDTTDQGNQNFFLLTPWLLYWVTQKLPQTCTVIVRIRFGKVAWFAVYICGNFWVTQYIFYLVRSDSVKCWRCEVPEVTGDVTTRLAPLHRYKYFILFKHGYQKCIILYFFSFRFPFFKLSKKLKNFFSF